MNRPGAPPSRPPALAPPPALAGFPRGGGGPPYQYMPPRPMQQQFGLPQQQQQQGPRTPAPVTPGSAGFAANRGGFPFGSAPHQQMLSGGNQLGQQQPSASNPGQQQQQQQQGPPSTTPSHQSLFSHPSDGQGPAGGQGGGANPSGAGLDPLDFPALSSLGTASQALPPPAAPPTPHSYASQASNPALTPQPVGGQPGNGGQRGGEFNNSEDFPALGGDMAGGPGHVNGVGAGLGNGTGTGMGVVGGGKFARGVSEDPRNPNYATKLAAAQSAWPSQNPTSNSLPAPQLAPPNSSATNAPTSPSSRAQAPSSSAPTYPPNLTNGSVALSSQPSAGYPAPPPDSHQHHPDGGPLPPQTVPAQQVISSPADKWGLQAFLHAIRNADEDKGMLSFGTDLMTLGVDMGGSDPLSSSLVAPWAEPANTRGVHLEEEYHTPSCYNVRPASAQGKMNLFAEETLFFIFYASPRDALQDAAAQELYTRHWRWHKDMGYWLTKDPRAEATEKTATYERGTYIFFDPASWGRVEQKDFNLAYEALEDRQPGPLAAQHQQHQQQPPQQQQQQQPPQQQQQHQQQQQQQQQQQMRQGQQQPTFGQQGQPAGM